MSNLRHVNAIAGRLSLRPPQRRSLEILDRITEIVPPHHATDLAAAKEIIASEYPGVVDFERDCFYPAVRALNPTAPIFEVSCRSGQGILDFGFWILDRLAKMR